MDIPKIRAAREAAVRKVLDEYGLATGRALDEDQVRFFFAELHERNLTQRGCESARRWILYGDPARYKTLTVGDFFPTEEQLARIGMSVNDLLLAEYKRGYRMGWDAGKAYATDELRQNAKYLKLRKDAARMVDLDARETMLESREEALREAERRLSEREAALRPLQRKIDRERANLAARERDTNDIQPRRNTSGGIKSLSDTLGGLNAKR